jgi:thiol-disulfide isomerase/thioredoxin
MRLPPKPRAWVTLGALLVLAAGAARVVLPPARAAGADPTAPAQPPAPELDGGKWLNGPPQTLKELRGKVVLIDFWEYTCVNCLRTLPYLKEWWRRYHDKGLVIIGVHTPEFQFARRPENIAAAVRELGLHYPILVDSDRKVWDAYNNRYWPAKYLIDAKGRVRYSHFGEGAYGATEQQIQRLLREVNPGVDLPRVMEPVRPEDGPGKVCYPVTPELYAGYERGGLEGTLGNREGYHPERTFGYRDPGSHEDGLLYAQGSWRSTAEALISSRDSPYPRDWIALRYHAIGVNAVLKPEASAANRVWVYQDGAPVGREDAGEDLQFDAAGRSFVLVDRPRMYSLIKNRQFGHHALRLAVSKPGLGLYAFTFTSCAMAQAPSRAN